MSAAANALAARAEDNHVSRFVLAMAYAWAEENDQAFQWLEKAYEEHEPLLSSFQPAHPRRHGDDVVGRLLPMPGQDQEVFVVDPGDAPNPAGTLDKAFSSFSAVSTAESVS